jgi:hypothetical protein
VVHDFCGFVDGRSWADGCHWLRHCLSNVQLGRENVSGSHSLNDVPLGDYSGGVSGLVDDDYAADVMLAHELRYPRDSLVLLRGDRGP